MTKSLYLKPLLVFYLYLSGMFLLNAQVYHGSEANDILSGTDIVKIDPKSQMPDYFKFREGEELPMSKFQNWLIDRLNLQKDLKLKLIKTEVDKLGFVHYRYQQYFKKIPLEWTHFFVHVKNDKVHSANGKIYNNLVLKINPRNTEAQAISSALMHVNAIKYKWEIQEEEELLKLESGNPSATYYPKGEMTYIAPNGGSNFFLAYKFDIYAQEPLSRAFVYIDAINGSVIFEQNRIHNDEVGSAVTKYSGTQTIMTTYNGSTYVLQETGRGNGIETYDMNTGTNYGAAVDFTDTDNFWNNVNAQQDEAATDAHWGAEMSYDYFLVKYGRNSIDDNGFKIKNYVHFYVNYLNAFWDGQRLTYGDGNGSPKGPYQSLDICGHEFAHGLTEYTAGLVYFNEPGALNESFSDIFGTCIEFYGKPLVANWLIGEDRGAASRSLEDPKLYGQPDTYLGINWYTGSGDNGGVHYNSGVQNYWFYLSSEGGSGVNDNIDAYTVTGIGIDSASSIAYRNLTVYLGPNTSYSDARFYSIISAADLYGDCSPAVETITNAWHAVGVGGPFSSSVSVDFSAPLTSSCNPPFTVQFTNLSSNGNTFNWDFGDGNTDTLLSPSHTYNSYGAFTVTLTADGGICGIDSATFIGYITIDSTLNCNTTLPSTDGGTDIQTGCAGTLYDNGGPNYTYLNNVSSSTTISPTGATSVMIITVYFDIEEGSGGSPPCDYDYVEFFDGPNTLSPSLGQYCNTTGPPDTIISSGGSLTVLMSGDAYVQQNGFEMQWTCTVDTSGPKPISAFTVSDTVSCSGIIEFTDTSLNNPTTWNWDFGDLTTSTQQNPSHSYANNGIYTVSLIASNNNGSDTLIKSAYINISKLTAPSATSASRCGDGTLTLTATGSGGTIYWYGDSSLNNFLDTGDNYLTNVISSTTNYYASETIRPASQQMGPADTLIGSGNFLSNASNKMVFNVYKAITLNSVKVYSTQLGFVTFELRDSNATLIDSRNLIVADGENTISLNFDILVGNNYQLGVATAWDLYSNSSGVSYPYTILDLASITGNNLADPNQYFYFYDWNVQELGCQSEPAIATATILENPSATIDSINNVSCFGLCNGSAFAAASGGTLPYTFEWSNAALGTQADSLCDGTYYVTVTDGMGCTGDTLATIIDGDTVSVSTNSVDANCGASDGQASANPTGGNSPYSYLWDSGSGNQTTQTAIGLSAGTYNVTVSDSNGCSGIGTTVVNNSTMNLTVDFTIDASCYQTMDGSAGILVTGGAIPYTYSWSPGSDTSAIATGLSAQAYTVTVVDSLGCTVDTSVTINEPAEILLSLTATDENCISACNGEANVNAVNGFAPLTYAWDDPGFQSDTTAYNLCSGPYNVTVTDSTGCIASGGISIGTGSGITASLNSLTNTMCGLCNGDATVDINNGIAPFTYQWGAGTGNQTSATASGLCEGTYTVIVSDSLGCADSLSAEILETGGIFASIDLTQSSDITCFGLTDGIASVIASGGSPPYAYLWSDPGAQTTATATGLAAGQFTVIVSDSVGCTANTYIDISEPAELSSSTSGTDASCQGLCDGFVSAAGSGGTGLYTYNWNTSPPQNTSVATGLCNGMYLVTITDNNGCFVTNGINIIEPPSIIDTTTINNATCNGVCNGIAKVYPNINSYTYVWDDPLNQTERIATGLCAGTFTVTVTDSLGCIATESVIITEPPSITLTMNSLDATCGGSDGQAIVNASNGIGAYTYNWDDPGSQTSDTAIVLFAGLYNVIVTDASNCSVTDSVFVNNSVPILTILDSSDATCFGYSDGSGSVSAIGGTLPYTYLWSTNPIQTDTMATGLPTGSYVVIVTDGIGCQATVTINIGEPTELIDTISVSNILCNSICIGSATISSSGGSGAYTYLWDDLNNQTTATATGLCAGSYNIIVADSNGCTLLDSTIISEPSQLTASLTGSNTSCYDLCDGTAMANTSGGVAPYQYLWDDSLSQTTANASMLCPGTYNIVITDDNGCVLNASRSINEPNPISLGTTTINTSCFGFCDGQGTVTASGGTIPYTYAWNDPYGQSKVTAEDLCAGTYTVIVKDNNNCSDSVIATITEPLDITASTTGSATSCYGACDGYATVSSSGGSGTHTYLWDDINTQTSGTATGLCVGLYTVIITDSNDCSKTKYYDVTQPAAIIPSFTSTLVSCYGNCDGTVSAANSGGIGPLTYLWNDPGAQTNNIAIGLCRGSIGVIITDSTGCIGQDSTTIAEPDSLSFSSTISNVTCNGQNDGAINLNVSGGTTPYSYAWSTNDSTQSIGGLSAGSYSILITDVNNCQDSSSFTVTEPNLLALNNSSIPVSCYGGNDGSIDISVLGGTAPFSFAWSTNDSTEDLSGISAGLYSVLVTDANNCTTSDSISITEPDSLVLGTSSTLVECNGDSSGTATVAVSGGTPPYTYTWNDPNSQTTSTAINLLAGNYAATVTDLNGCLQVESITLFEPDPISFISITTDPSCSGLCDGDASVQTIGGFAPYTYMWDDPGMQSNATATGLCSGTYHISVSDANGCIVSDSISLFEPDPVTFISSSTDPNCFNGCDGEATIQAIGGITPYTFVWDDPGMQTNATATGLCSGIYNITISDANGCDTATSETLNEPNELLLSAVAAGESGIGANDGTVDLTISGGTSPYSYAWSNAAATEDLSGLSTGTFTVTVTDNAGCFDTLSIFVSQLVGIIANQNPEIEINVFPNPSQGKFLLTAIVPTDESCTIILMDLKGKLLFEEDVRIINGIYYKQFSLGDIATGIYTLQIYVGDKIFSKRILVE
ncbi:MAG TPA: PKD domain-containing protein [Flavobacteriales bacterium]|nr:PKD domain-containing protein [Flavobacteriales bacterium]